MTLTLYLLRHGQTTFSKDNMFCGSGLDPELTEDGKEMAQCFADYYKTFSWTAAYTSPLKRTIATATPLCNACGITTTPTQDLREIEYGAWEGKTVEYVNEHYHDDYVKWGADPAWNPPTNGERASTIAHRVLRVVDDIKEKYTSGNILLVSHKATIRILLCSLLGIDVGRFRTRLACPVGSVNIVQFNPSGPLLIRLADTFHLTERLRNLPGT